MAAHHIRRLQTPPPMSPASTSAHNFYNTFASRRGNTSPPPPIFTGPAGNPAPPPAGPPPRPSSAMPNTNGAGGFYQASNYVNSNYVNAQYYQPERQSTMTAIPPALNSAYSRPIQSATFAPNHPQYGRPSPPPINPNAPYNANAGSAIRRPASAVGKIPGQFPEDISSPRNDLPLRQNPTQLAPILGIKAAARQRELVDQVEEEPETPKVDNYWGDLFNKSDSPPTATETLSHFLRGIADYIIAEFEPKNSLVITPPKMLAFYTKFRAAEGERLSWDNFFFGRPVKSLSEIYQALNCHHHLVPAKDSKSTPPVVPSLTPQGFERWMTIQILSDPDRESKRLIHVLKTAPIQNAYEKDPMMKRFPKTLTRESFPKFTDGDMRGLWDLFVPDDDPIIAAAATAATRAAANPPPSRGNDQEQHDRELARERERDQRVLEVLQDRDSGSRSLTPRGGGYAPPPPLPKEEHAPEHLAYKSKPPPPIPNDRGVERTRSPYSRANNAQKEALEDEYEQLSKMYGYENIDTRIPLSPNAQQQGAPMLPPKTQPISPPLSKPGNVDKRLSDFDREEDDLYQIMAAKRAEIAAIEERLQKQTHTPPVRQQEEIPFVLPIEMASPQPSMDAGGGYDSDEEAAIRKQAEDDWDREAREREKWVEARRRKLEQGLGLGDDLEADFQPVTPVSHYSWRESYSTPAPATTKRNTPPQGRPAAPRLSGGGEWEEFRIDHESPNDPRRTSVAQGHGRSYSGASSGWPRDHY